MYLLGSMNMLTQINLRTCICCQPNDLYYVYKCKMFDPVEQSSSYSSSKTLLGLNVSQTLVYANNLIITALTFKKTETSNAQSRTCRLVYMQMDLSADGSFSSLSALILDNLGLHLVSSVLFAVSTINYTLLKSVFPMIFARLSPCCEIEFTEQINNHDPHSAITGRPTLNKGISLPEELA